MKRYKVGVIGADSLIGKNLLKTLLKRNFPYSLIRALDNSNEKKEIKVDDYIFSLTSLNNDSLLDLDLIFVIDINIDSYLNFLKEKNKYVVIISNNKDYSEYKFYDVNFEHNIYLVNNINALVLAKLLSYFEYSKLDLLTFHSVIENGDQEIDNLKQQYYDYFNYRPLMGSNLIYRDNKKIPLAFNIVPYANNSNYLNFYKDEVHHLLAKDFEFTSCDFYIPSFCSNAMKVRLEGVVNNDYLEKINNDDQIKIYPSSPSLIECEGNELIHLGNININEDIVCFFLSFDYSKILCVEAVKIMEKRISYDQVS